MGDEVSLPHEGRLRRGPASSVTQRLDDSLEAEKEKNDFLAGVPAIVEAHPLGQDRVPRLPQGQVPRQGLHHPRAGWRWSARRPWSARRNFTLPGPHREHRAERPDHRRARSTVLQEWFEEHWNDAEDVTPEILETIERHTREYTPVRGLCQGAAGVLPRPRADRRRSGSETTARRCTRCSTSTRRRATRR